jgi:hypothetical protein
MTGDGEELVCRRVVEDREVIEELERIAVMVRSDKFLMKLRLGEIIRISFPSPPQRTAQPHFSVKLSTTTGAPDCEILITDLLCEKSYASKRTACSPFSGFSEPPHRK